jgi:hypothetical protein
MADPKVYNEEETAVLRQARHLRDMVESPGWREFVKILEAQIRYREGVLTTPIGVLSQASEEFRGMDYQSKQAQLESIKGALIALRMCRDLPQTTIEQARDIVRDHGDSDQEPT